MVDFGLPSKLELADWLRVTLMMCGDGFKNLSGWKKALLVWMHVLRLRREEEGRGAREVGEREGDRRGGGILQTPKRSLSSTWRGTWTTVKGCKLQASSLYNFWKSDTVQKSFRCSKYKCRRSAQLCMESTNTLTYYIKLAGLFKTPWCYLAIIDLSLRKSG